MFKLVRGFNFRQLRTLEGNTITRNVQSLNVDNKNEEIVQTILGDFVTIGINIPDTKNVLTETALEKLHESVKNFESDDKLSSAVLYGFGGNFCRGMVTSSHATDLGFNLLKALHTLKKPVIGALDGYTRGFGLLLALTCDMRVIEEKAVVGLYDKEQKPEIPTFMYERLVLTMGLAKTTELVCTRNTWTASECLSAGLANQITGTGCSQGVAILWAQSIAFTNPLEKVVEHKSRILSVLSKKGNL